jgi:hypothetical protein
MRLIRIALALALALALAPAAIALALAMPTTASAATRPPLKRIVLFDGRDATPVGPKVLPPGKWTVSSAPAKITTTNYGTLMEDTHLGAIGDCATHCGEWWFDSRPSWVQLAEFYWQKPNGRKVLAKALVPVPDNNSVWVSLGNGTYTPQCLGWMVTTANGYTLYYIKLNLHTHHWSEITPAKLSTC